MSNHCCGSLCSWTARHEPPTTAPRRPTRVRVQSRSARIPPSLFLSLSLFPIIFSFLFSIFHFLSYFFSLPSSSLPFPLPARCRAARPRLPCSPSAPGSHPSSSPPPSRRARTPPPGRAHAHAHARARHAEPRRRARRTHTPHARPPCTAARRTRSACSGPRHAARRPATALMCRHRRRQPMRALHPRGARATARRASRRRALHRMPRAHLPKPSPHPVTGLAARAAESRRRTPLMALRAALRPPPTPGLATASSQL